MPQLDKQLAAKFPAFEKALIEEMAEFGQLRQLKEGEVIIQPGQNIRSAMLVIEGLIKIFRQDDEGNEYFMYYLDEGKACALSLVCAVKKETSEILAMAVSEATLLIIPLEKVDQWMVKYKSWAEFALRSYRERFEELLLTIDHIAFRNMDARLVHYLKQYQEKLKTNQVSTSFTTIAKELNSSREVISRLMRKLSEKGLIKMHNSYVELLDLDHAFT
jgi:CRP/FNR family transcriptional regulator